MSESSFCSQDFTSAMEEPVGQEKYEGKNFSPSMRCPFNVLSATTPIHVNRTQSPLRQDEGQGR